MFCNVEFLFRALCGRRVMVDMCQILTAYIYRIHSHIAMLCYVIEQCCIHCGGHVPQNYLKE